LSQWMIVATSNLV